MPEVVVKLFSHTPAVPNGRPEHLIFLEVPAAGGDGMLLGVVDSLEAAKAIASALRSLLSRAGSTNEAS